VKLNKHFWSYLARFFLEWDKFQNRRENQNTILRSITIFLFRKLYRLWDNVGKKIVQPSGPQMTIRRILIACWIPKATNTHSQYVILIAFPLQQWLHDRASLLRTLSAVLSFILLYTSYFLTVDDGRRLWNTSRSLRFSVMNESTYFLTSFHILLSISTV